MTEFDPLAPLFIPSFSSKGNILIPNDIGGNVSDNYELLQVLGVRISNGYLLSAYDVYYGFMPQDPSNWPDTSYLFVDSGGYETSDGYDLSERNKYNYLVHSWDSNKMKEVYQRVISCPKFKNSTIIISVFDLFAPFEEQLQAAQRIAEEFPTTLVDFIIKFDFTFDHLLTCIKDNIDKLHAIPIIGITEKELGATIREKLLNLIALKKLLLSLGWYGRIHIFGGLEMNMSALYYIAGADIFDGLSWQRMRYRYNSTVYDPRCYDIDCNEFENKYYMMVDNLAALQKHATMLSLHSENRTNKMNQLEKILQGRRFNIQSLLDELEV